MTSLLQNIVLSWLAGSRIIELKTVQILDELKIPRPCIDATNVGYNVEWSQELKLGTVASRVRRRRDVYRDPESLPAAGRRVCGDVHGHDLTT